MFLPSTRKALSVRGGDVCHCPRGSVVPIRDRVRRTAASKWPMRIRWWSREAASDDWSRCSSRKPWSRWMSRRWRFQQPTIRGTELHSPCRCWSPNSGARIRWSSRGEPSNCRSEWWPGLSWPGRIRILKYFERSERGPCSNWPSKFGVQQRMLRHFCEEGARRKEHRSSVSNPELPVQILREESGKTWRRQRSTTSEC